MWCWCYVTMRLMMQCIVIDEYEVLMYIGSALSNDGYYNAHFSFKRFEKRVMRGIHCEILTFKSLMGNEDYFETMRCVVVFIGWVMCAKRGVLGGPESGRRGWDEFFGIQALGVRDTRCEYTLKPVPIPHGGCIPATQCDPDRSPDDSLRGYVTWFTRGVVSLVVCSRHPTRFSWERYRITFRIES